MSQLQYNEIRIKKIIIYNNEPYEVVESHVARTQQRKPQNQVKLKSLISGKTIAATFHASEKAHEADVERREIKFLYHNKPARPPKSGAGGGEYFFCDPEDPKDRYKLDATLLEGITKFLKENSNVIALIWDNANEAPSTAAMAGQAGSGLGKIIKVILPIKMTFKVKEAPPAVRGDTSKAGNKIITLENGTTLNAPMFIKEGDIVNINTETGIYVERVKS